MVSTMAAGELMLGAVPPKPPRSAAVRVYVSDGSFPDWELPDEAGAPCRPVPVDRVVDKVVEAAPRATPVSTPPTTASTPTNKRSGTSRPRITLETLIAAEYSLWFQYTSGRPAI
jgi:hypothetical protein